MSRTALIGLSAAGLFFAGYATARKLGADELALARKAAEEAPSVTSAAASIDYGRIASIVHGAIERRCANAQELADSDSEGSRTTAARGRMQDEDQLEEQVVVFEQARTRVDGAIVRGVWTSEDAAFVHSHAAKLTPEQRDRLSSAIATAVNAQRLEVQTFPPF